MPEHSPPSPADPRADVAGAERVQELVARHQGMVRSIAWTILQRLPKHVEIEELVSDGNVGLMQAARNYDASRGAQFTTYAWRRVRGAIFAGLTKRTWFRPADYYASKYEYVAGEVLAGGEEAGREPASDGAWLKGVGTRLATASMVAGYVEGMCASDEPPVDDPLLGEEQKSALREALERLPDQERTLVQAMYFDGRSLTEASRGMQITKGWASRLHARALERLALELKQAQVWS